ncbi:MAG: restriction endonuclease subunit S [Firmicutes bacterium]|nr:restriction endonuclease subunit S [Bacillota bacterium]
MISSLRLVSECGDTSHVAPVGTNTYAWTLVAPPHWHRKRLGMLCKLNPPKRRFQGIDDNAQASFLPMELAKANNPSFETRIVRMADVANGFTPFQDGDLLIAKITPCFENGKGGIARGLVSGIGFGSTEFHVLRPRSEIDVRFLYYATICRPFREIGAAMMRGSAGQKRIPAGFLSNFVMPFPNIEGQRLIVRFLDYSVRLINHLIRAKRQQIKLLNEQKQVIINQAVTRGLDPNVGMKPSGIEWLGDVPEHWQMTRLKYLAQFVSGGTPSTSTPSFWNGNIPWVSPKDMKYFEIRDTRDHVTERAIQAGKTALVPAGAVLMVVRSGILQRTIPVAVACREVAINQDLKAIIVDDELLVPEFLSMVVIGNQQALLALWRKQGATVESLEYKWILNTVFPVPPVQEQRAILTVLLPRLMEIEKTIEHVQREIDLLHEYRTRLIADVVTGKLDVRGGELPDIDVSEGLDEWDEEEGIGQEEIIEPEEMDVDEYN